MKQISGFIYEKLIINKNSKITNNSADKKLIDNIEKLAINTIDYYNQEGVYGFDEEDWKRDYNTGKKEPDFQNLIAGMLEDTTDKKIINLLEKYPNTDLKEDIELAILRAGVKYMKDLSWGY